LRTTSRAFLGGRSRLGRRYALADDLVGLGRIFLQPVAQLFVGRTLHQRLHGRVAELGLRLTLELGIA